MKRIALIALLLLLACLVFADMVPDFRLPDGSGKKVSLADLTGKGPIIIDFWADYCKPCKDAMPYLDALAQKYDSLTVVVVSIDAPKSLAKAKAFIKSKNYKVIDLYDSEKTFAKKVNVSNPPFTLILDAEGNIVYSHVGFTPGMEVEYEHHVRSLLGLSTEAE